MVSATQPNPAHVALAQLADQKPVTLVTQNIDGLHQQAGRQHVVELHGNLFANKWLDGCGTLRHGATGARANRRIARCAAR